MWEVSYGIFSLQKKIKNNFIAHERYLKLVTMFFLYKVNKK